MSASTNRIWSSDGLPSEILIRILHLCDYKAIIRLSMTCKRSYKLSASLPVYSCILNLKPVGWKLSTNR
ncbi:hypothetical protein B0J17DRAFT_116927 [Rhizoctonia solani]|nr:hypothetical protein B0J17DRAFT_116927 [Rhizoctonia solani]